MLRTNSKQARANIMAYIRQDIDYLMERDSTISEESSDAEVCRVIWDIFESEKYYTDEYIRRHSISKQQVFTDWAQGLALGGLFCYYYNRSAVEDLGDILEETEDERNRYTEQQAEEMLTRLIYNEIQRGLSK